MHVLEVPTQVTALREVLLADFALVGPLHRVLPEVTAQVAALTKYGFAAFVLAPEVQFCSLSFAIVDLDGFVPLLRDAFELLGERSFPVHILILSRTFPRNSAILVLLRARGI